MPSRGLVCVDESSSRGPDTGGRPLPTIQEFDPKPNGQIRFVRIHEHPAQYRMIDPEVSLSMPEGSEPVAVPPGIAQWNRS